VPYLLTYLDFNTVRNSVDLDDTVVWTVVYFMIYQTFKERLTQFKICTEIYVSAG